MKFNLKKRALTIAPEWVVPEMETPGWGRTECGNPACSSRWLAFLKDRRRPVFEGRWGCTAGCVEAMVQVAIQRESGDDGVMEGERQHRHRMPLGLILLAQGWITHPQLQHALDAQRRAGTGGIGSGLIAEGGFAQH